MAKSIERQESDVIHLNNTGDSKKRSLDLRVGSFHKYKLYNDSQLKSKIKKKLEDYPIIDPAEIKVSVNNGIITLTGYIDAYWKYKRIQDVCNNMIGVFGVINKLIIIPSRYNFDCNIKSNILNKLKGNSFINGDSINVSVKKGTVILSGNVESWIEYRTILKIVEKISGVNDIIDNLLIDSFVNITDKISNNR
ncbi:MAG: BON domain-containing protein [Candidatus Lokiarchaeota archaeon]|nr:BON domain-containing protein [Candidatus Lokiarchaeota archaeon]